ncbi:MAG: DNA repair protein RecO [Chthoniobacterales bacterium]
METTVGILLRKIRFTESSLIVTWFGEHSGKIKTMIRSALKTKSKFAGKADLFYEAEVFYTRSKKSELCDLQDIVVRNRFSTGSSDYATLIMFSYFAELIEATTELFHPAPDIYDLLRRAFVHLDTDGPSLRALHHFEKELCRHLGVLNTQVPSDLHYRSLLEYSGKPLALRNTLTAIFKEKDDKTLDC